MAENSHKTARKRGPGRQFKRGKSGNPGGRPKSDLDQYIREKTRDGEELADCYLAIARGAVVRVTFAGEERELLPEFSDRLKALGELARLGRFPVTPITIETTDLSRLSDEQLDQLEQLAAAARSNSR